MDAGDGVRVYMPYFQFLNCKKLYLSIHTQHKVQLTNAAIQTRKYVSILWVSIWRTIFWVFNFKKRRNVNPGSSIHKFNAKGLSKVQYVSEWYQPRKGINELNIKIKFKSYVTRYVTRNAFLNIFKFKFV